MIVSCRQKKVERSFQKVEMSKLKVDSPTLDIKVDFIKQKSR